MLSPARLLATALSAVALLAPPSLAFDSPLSEEAVREAYFLGQRNNQSTLSFSDPYIQTLPAPEKGPHIAEVEVYTPYVQIIEASRRRSMGYSAQQAEQDYRHHRDKLYIRVRIDFSETYGALELYRSPKSGRKRSGDDQPLPDFYRDFRVGLSQRFGPSREDRWIEPLRIILQSAYTQNSNHYPFVPEDLSLFSFATTDVSSYAYSSANGFVYPTGWLVWLVYDASDVASDDATVEVITTDGQHISVPYDLARLR
jgi:hypothetical protein